ncbi:MAG: ATP-binding protein [Novosphingobium sp.]|nr:ATP-binding protein [Novosphingobium sp.]
MSAGDDPAAASLAALAAAEDFASEAGLDAPGAARLAVVVDELVSNAVRHGVDDGSIAIELAMAVCGGEVSIVLEDDGVAFDPTQERGFRGPDPETGGGVGLALVKAWAKGFAYSRENGRNRIELRLRLA